MQRNCAVEMRGVTKTFGEVVAADSVSIDVRPGEILALLGENGSGKTTLMNMLSGIYFPDSGEIRINGRQVTIASPRDAIDAGIGMIHQHFKLVDVLTAAENIVLGLRGALAPGRGPQLNRAKLSAAIGALANRYGFALNPDQKVYRMSVGEKQTVEILKALYRGADILILDEPTAVLTPQETQRLFDVLRAMREDGKAIVLISHKLGEVLSVSDRVTVLRKGQCVGTVPTREATAQYLTEMMVGRPIELAIERLPAVTRPMMTVRDLTILGADGRPQLDGATFDLRAGEILGVAGVAGSGQMALCEGLCGLLRANKGTINVDGADITNRGPTAAANAGVRMGFVPEDRLGMGLVASMDITENLLVRTYRRQPGPFLRRNGAREQARKLISWLDVSTTGPGQRVSTLSGGNVQKVLIGRELMEAPRVLIVAYPVRGLDIGASYTVYHLLQEQKQKGVAVLFIGEDLDVLMELCDRLIVLSGGRVTGTVDAGECTKDAIGLMMTQGGVAQEAANAGEGGSR